MQIVTKDGKGKNARSITVEYPLHNTLAANAKAFGESTVNNLFVDSAVIAIQGIVRRAMKDKKKPKTVRQIQDAVTAYKLGERMRKPADPDKLAAQIAKLQARLEHAKRAKVTTKAA